VSGKRVLQLEEQLKERSQFEHQIISKFEEITSKYHSQND